MFRSDKQHGLFAGWTVAALLVLAGYVLSSGPVLATAFWLREATGWNVFYAVMWIYYPLIAMGHDNPIDAYIEWWVRAFGTVGPG